MKDTPTPRTDAVRFRVGESDHWAVVHEVYAKQLERELAEMEEQCESWANQSMSWKLKADVLSRQLEELKEWQTLAIWGGTPQHVHEFIKGQQARIHAAQDAEEQRDRLAEAARAVVDRWETPLWKGTKHTGKFIRALADALDAIEGGQP